MDKVGWHKHNFTNALSFEKKDELRRALEEALPRTVLRVVPMKVALVSIDSFPLFPQLPFELRIAIWELAFGPDRLSTVVHCIDERGGRFISNQPILPLLHICQEARNIYMSRPGYRGVTFAFGSHVNFRSDIIYLINFENDPEKFCRFLESRSVRGIQKLAMRKSLACNIPMMGRMGERQWEMKEILESWKELAVVIQDSRTLEEAWRDTGMQIRDLSAREKRRHAEIAPVRCYTKTLTSMMRTAGAEKTTYRFSLCRLRRRLMGKRLCHAEHV